MDNFKSIEQQAEELKASKTAHRLYSMFIGRWQPFHEGHQWLIDQRRKEGKNVLLAIRDVPVDFKNPWTAKAIHAALSERFAHEISLGTITLVIIPDIESINYGRDVGYEVIEHKPPKNVAEVSATKIRNKMMQSGDKSYPGHPFEQ